MYYVLYGVEMLSEKKLISFFLHMNVIHIIQTYVYSWKTLMQQTEK